jgi:hypothetical protein
VSWTATAVDSRPRLWIDSTRPAGQNADVDEQPPDTPSDELRRLQAEAKAKANAESEAALRSAMNEAAARRKRAEALIEEARRLIESFESLPPELCYPSPWQPHYQPGPWYLRFPPQRKDRR